MLILGLLKQGKPNKIIAYELNLSESTVKVHIRNILAKLGVKNRTEAVYSALQIAPNKFDENHSNEDQLHAERHRDDKKPVEQKSAAGKKAVVAAVPDYNQGRRALIRELAETVTTPALKARLLNDAAD